MHWAATVLEQIVTNPLWVSLGATALLVVLGLIVLWPFLCDTTTPEHANTWSQRDRQPADVVAFRRQIFQPTPQPTKKTKSNSEGLTPLKRAPSADKSPVPQPSRSIKAPVARTSQREPARLSLNEQIARLRNIMETGAEQTQKLANLQNKAKTNLRAAEYRLTSIISDCEAFLPQRQPAQPAEIIPMAQPAASAFTAQPTPA